MSPRIHIAGQWWPLQKDKLTLLKESCTEAWEREAVQVLTDWWSEGAEMTSLTSGSTGSPKPIVHAKKAMVESAERTIRFFKLLPGTQAVLVLPARFIGGKMMIIRALVGGWDIKIERPGALPEGVVPCDFIAMTPAQATALVEHRPKAWEQLGTVLLGGSAVDDSLIQQMPAGPKVFESFGMTETISHFALRQLVPIQEAAFQCLEGFEVVQTEDSVLEIVFPNGKHLKTNDAVKVTGASAFEWLGRRDDVINSGGIKIHPAQIERALASLIPGPFKVYGEYHATWGTQLVLRVHATAPPANASQLEAEWTAWAKRHLPPHHSPKRIEWKELKQTGSGKWLRP